MMHCVLGRTRLLKALQTVCGSLGGRLAAPILSHVLIRSRENGTVDILATDNEVEMQALQIEAEVLNAGAIAVPGRKLLDIVRMLPEMEQLSLKADQTQCIVTGHRRRFSLMTLPTETLPRFSPLSPESNYWEVEQSTLKWLLEGTGFAMAQQDVRHCLNGTLLVLSNHDLQAVATDGHRLALRQAPVQSMAESKQTLLLPKKAALELLRWLDADSTQSCQIGIGKRQATFKLGNCLFSTRLIEGQFPDYGHLVQYLPPQKNDVETADFKQALMRVAVLSNEKSKVVTLRLEGEEVQLRASNALKEQAEEVLSIQGPKVAAPVELSFNVSYLLDVVNTIKTPALSLFWKDSSTGVVFSPKDELSSLSVIMPVRR